MCTLLPHLKHCHEIGHINKVRRALLIDRRHARLFACEERLPLSVGMKSNHVITVAGHFLQRGKWSRYTRNTSSLDDTCTVPKLPPGLLAKLLPAATTVRRPLGKLVQLVVQAIHKSLQRALRVQHVYLELQCPAPAEYVIAFAAASQQHISSAICALSTCKLALGGDSGAAVVSVTSSLLTAPPGYIKGTDSPRTLGICGHW
ncbi:uncharacterized protein LOC144115314 [Amblyomma americanum]